VVDNFLTQEHAARLRAETLAFHHQGVLLRLSPYGRVAETSQSHSYRAEENKCKQCILLKESCAESLQYEPPSRGHSMVIQGSLLGVVSISPSLSAPSQSCKSTHAGKTSLILEVFRLVSFTGSIVDLPLLERPHCSPAKLFTQERPLIYLGWKACCNLKSIAQASSDSSRQCRAYIILTTFLLQAGCRRHAIWATTPMASPKPSYGEPNSPHSSQIAGSDCTPP
jgi:hypothetical protein